MVFSDSSVNFSLLSDVPYASVDVMPYFRSNDEPQRFKYNITEVNPSLWSQYEDESGLVNIPPYKAKLITQKPVYMKQYPLSPEKIEGIQPVIDNFYLLLSPLTHLTIHQSMPSGKLMERVGV